MELPDLLIEEYKALRAEITQSIVKQHWIAAGGYVLSGTIAAAIMHDLRANCMGLMLIPLCFFSAACLWLVECNRMVRASYFIDGGPQVVERLVVVGQGLVDEFGIGFFAIGDGRDERPVVGLAMLLPFLMSASDLVQQCRETHAMLRGERECSWAIRTIEQLLKASVSETSFETS